MIHIRFRWSGFSVLMSFAASELGNRESLRGGVRVARIASRPRFADAITMIMSSWYRR
jgi:hypothetical protein